VPSYTSGVQICPGKADNLKKTAIKIRINPTTNKIPFDALKPNALTAKEITKKSVEPVAIKIQRIPVNNNTDVKAPKL